MNDDNNTKQPILNHLSLCTGYEGIGQGLRRVLPTLREIAYSEIEDYAIANLVAKIEEGRLHPAPIFTNLKTLPFREFLGKVSILSGGFPCQPFSQAGLRKATDDPRHLYPFIAEGISQCKPAFVFLENVQGIISAKTHEGESVLHYVCRDLESRGYKVSWGVFSAEECGFPHQRKRVFILGVSNTKELVDTNCEGFQGQSQRQNWFSHDTWETSEWVETKIPARPNEPQHEWEYPRVITKGIPQPKLGGESDGFRNRDNRLRLLGNGVVPQVAAKAFKTLLQKNLTT